MNMWGAMGHTYRMSARFVVAVPLVAALAIGAEALQHLVEWRIGMFDSMAAAEAVEGHELRMGFGYVKLAALFLVGFWAVRFLGFAGDAARALAFDRTAWRLFAWVLLFQAFMVVANKQAGSLLAAIVPGGGTLLLAGLAAMLAAMLLELYLAAWKAGAALGNPRMTVPASIRLMHGSIWWSFGFTLAMMIPAMVAHYALNLLAMGRPPAIAWSLLAFDSLLVGYLAVLLPASVAVAALRAAQRKQVELVPLPAGEARPVLAPA